MRIVDPTSIRPNEIKAGDVMMCTVTLHIFDDGDGGLLFRMYRCRHDGPRLDAVPQGTRMYGSDEHTIQEQLFPVVGWAEAKPDFR